MIAGESDFAIFKTTRSMEILINSLIRLSVQYGPILVNFLLLLAAGLVPGWIVV